MTKRLIPKSTRWTVVRYTAIEEAAWKLEDEADDEEHERCMTMKGMIKDHDHDHNHEGQNLTRAIPTPCVPCVT